MTARISALLIALVLVCVSMREACACDTPPRGTEAGCAVETATVTPTVLSEAHNDRGPADEGADQCQCLCCPFSGFPVPACFANVEPPRVSAPPGRSWPSERRLPSDFSFQIFHPPR